jgi:hypothetical protein
MRIGKVVRDIELEFRAGPQSRSKTQGLVQLGFADTVVCNENGRRVRQIEIRPWPLGSDRDAGSNPCTEFGLPVIFGLIRVVSEFLLNRKEELYPKRSGR